MLKSAFYSKVVRPLFSISKLGRNIVSGRADSGLNIDYMYSKKPHGINPIGKFLDNILLNLPTVKATRTKKDIIIKILKNEIENNMLLKKKTRILDLASGPARYLVELLNSNRNSGIEVLCLDMDKKSLSFGKIIAKDHPIRYARANLFSLERLKRFGKKVGWAPDIIMVTGFFEMQCDEVVKNFFKEISCQLSSDGLILFTAQKDNPSAELMKDIGVTQDNKRWEMFLRPPQLYRKWLLDAGFRNVIISVDTLGMYEYCTGRRGH